MSSGSSNGIFPTSPPQGTGIGFVNPEDIQAVVVLTAYDGQGEAIAMETVILEAGERVLDMVERIFDQDISEAVYVSYASDANLVGFSLAPSLVRHLIGPDEEHMPQ